MAFDDQIREALDRGLAEARRTLEESFAAFSQDMSKLVADERAQVSAQAIRVIADARRQVDEAHRQAEQARQQTEQAQQQLQQAADATAHLEAQLADIRRQAEAQLTQVRDAAHRQVADIRRTAETQVAELNQAVADLRAQAQLQLDQARQSAHAEFERMRVQAERQVGEARRVANAEAEDLLVAQLAAAAADNDTRTREAVANVRQEHHAAELAAAGRLADAVRALDNARSLGELLAYLAECAGREVDRAAVLVVKGDRLQAWRLTGFGPSAPPAKSVLLDFDSAGAAGVAARSAVEVSYNGAGGPEQLPAFARDLGARRAYALPILVGGAVVAVLYADAATVVTGPQRWMAVLEVLTRHVSRALESMTVRRAVGLSLPRPMAHASQPPGQPVAAAGEAGRIQ